MRVIALFVSALLSFPPHSQQTAVTSPQGSQFLQKALIALAPNLSLTDVTLSGSVRRIAGSDDQSGSAVLKALSSGAARTDLSFSSGTRSEVVNSSSSTPTGAWSGFDGVSHRIAFHNLLSEPAWFFPVFAVSHRLSSGYIATDLGPETHNDQLVEHIPVEIHFSDYRSVNGVQVPFHVEKFLNNSLVLDFQAQSAAINSGLSVSE